MIMYEFCLVFVLLHSLEAARILAVFPTPSISHQVVFRPYTQELARRGHEVVIITTDPVFSKDNAPSNLKEIDVHDISYKIWRKEFVTLIKGNKDDTIEAMKTAFRLINLVFEKQLETEEIKNLLMDKSQKFDLIVSEACARPGLIFSHLYQVPLIQFSSFGSMVDSSYVLGYPTNPLLYPGTLNQRLYNLNIWEKIDEFYKHFKFQYIFSEIEEEENVMLKRIFGPNTPIVRELYNNIHLLFLNVHPIWEDNRPVPPGVIHVGGIHQKPEKELPKDLKSYLDSSRNGVIYISFGTNVDPSLMSPEKIQIFVKVFSELPYDILWKWNKDVLPGKTENIKISKWLPQPDLLRHKKLKLFITQGGLQSTDEALAAGVPLIGIPMLGDQWYNVEKYVRHNIGLRLDIETITEDKLRNAINKVINDESYRNNIKKLRSLMQDTPVKPLETSIWWTEYILRHKGAKQLRSPSANMPWTEYYEVKLLLSVSTLILLIFSSSFYLVKNMIRSITKKEKLKKA